MHYFIYFFILGLVVGVSSTRAVGILLRERRKKLFARLQEKRKGVLSPAVTINFLGWEDLKDREADHSTDSYLGAPDADDEMEDYAPFQLCESEDMP